MDDDRGRVEVVRQRRRSAVGQACERRGDDRRAARAAQPPLGRAQAQVDRDRDGAEAQAAVERLGERPPGRQRDRHAVARADAERPQALGGERRGRVELGVRQRAVVGAQRDVVRACAGRAVKPGLDDRHGCESSLHGMSVAWTPAGEYADIRYELSGDGIAKITIDRPEVRNAFRPQTIVEISDALTRAREDTSVGVIILTGEGPLAFCSGGDQNVRGDTGYLSEPGTPGAVGRFHVTDLHIQIRRLPKPVVAMVAGYAIGGGHVLHLVCDLTIAADNARFGQVGPRVGSFDGGFGAGLLASLVGPKKAKEMWFLCRQYDAGEALDDGPRQHRRRARASSSRRPSPGVARCSRCRRSRCGCCKASFNAAEDGFSGIQQLAHDANLLFYENSEAQEGRDAYREKRTPDFSRFPKRP